MTPLPRFKKDDFVMLLRSRQIGRVASVEYLPISGMYRYTILLPSKPGVPPYSVYSTEDGIIAADNNVEYEALRNIVELLPYNVDNDQDNWDTPKYEASLQLAKRMRQQGFSFNEIEELLTEVYREIAEETVRRMCDA